MADTASKEIHQSGLLPLVYIGFAATVIGIGLGRFSFVALIPVLIQGGWADAEIAGFLAASNLLGYLIGALTANRLGRRFGPQRPILAGMLFCTASFVASAWNLGTEWLALWRCVAGIAGGVLMVLAAPTVLRSTPTHRKGRVTGTVFSGIGVGVAISGFAVPWASEDGVMNAWLALGTLCALATLPCLILRRNLPNGPQMQQAASSSVAGSFWTKALIALIAAYALDAIGFIPHTIYWADFLARSLGHSNSVSGLSWSLFGFGAILGPVLAGVAADRFGFRRSLLGAFLIKTGAVILPYISQDMILLNLSVILVGALTPGIVALVSGTAAALVGPERHAGAWGLLTFIFAIFQALGGYAIAGLFSVTGSHHILFAAGAAALAVGTACTIAILLINPPKD